MSLESIRKKAQDAIITNGRALVHAKNPDDFEYYAISFELVDSEFNSLRIFHMPVLPTAISIGRTSPLNIKKTGWGYFTQYSDAFQARQISIQGTFGRKFRLIVNKEESDKKLKDYDLNIKTGYGVTKVLEEMLLQSQQASKKNTNDLGNSVIEENHKFLIMYNLTFNQQFVVEVMNKSFTQSVENNMMWNYQIELRAVGDVRNLIGYDLDKSLKNLLTNAKLNSNLNTVFNNITAGGVVDAARNVSTDLISF